jgi:hypothetical protein
MSDKLVWSNSSFFVGWGFFFFVFFFLFDFTAHALVSLFDESVGNSLLLGEADHGVLAFSDAEDVVKSGGEKVTSGVLDVSNLVWTGVVFDVLEDTDSADIVSSLNENRRAVFVFDATVNITSLKVEL